MLRSYLSLPKCWYLMSIGLLCILISITDNPVLMCCVHIHRGPLPITNYLAPLSPDSRERKRLLTRQSRTTSKVNVIKKRNIPKRKCVATAATHEHRDPDLPQGEEGTVLTEGEGEGEEGTVLTEGEGDDEEGKVISLGKL